jgi:methylisocitrate lyase
VVRTAQEFGRAGVAGLHLEDLATKKHGGPFPVAEARRRLAAALASRRDPGTVVIARTDAAAPWRDGVADDRAACDADAFERCVAYAAEGADLVMPMGVSMDWLRRHGCDVPVPIAVLSGPTLMPGGELDAYLPADELAVFNVKLVIHPTYMLVRTYRFMKTLYAQWLAAGRFDATEQDARDRSAINELVGIAEKQDILARYGGS